LDYFYLTVLLQLAFYVLFVATMARFLLRPSRLELAVVAVFGSTAAIFGYPLVNGLNVRPAVARS
jgi:hypothetical protein